MKINRYCKKSLTLNHINLTWFIFSGYNASNIGTVLIISLVMSDYVQEIEGAISITASSILLKENLKEILSILRSHLYRFVNVYRDERID